MNTRLEEIARRVNWYSDSGRLLANVDLFLSQVMARGTADEIVDVQRHFSEEDFRNAYFFHLREELPPDPRRRRDGRSSRHDSVDRPSRQLAPEPRQHRSPSRVAIHPPPASPRSVVKSDVPHRR